MDTRHYERAPIVEAIIDISLRWKQPPQTADLRACHEKLKHRFPKLDPLHTFQMGLNLGGGHKGVRFQSGHAESGLRLSSKAGDRVLQIQPRSFTYSHLPPYTRWETFRDEAKSSWQLFLETCRPEAVTRLAVRFVNKIVIPETMFELFDYFHLYPQVPKGIPQNISGLLMQLQMPQEDIGRDAVAVINLAMDTSKAPTEAAMLLDFDVSLAVSELPSSDRVWSHFEELRKRKNELFEACITDKTRELIL